MAKGLSGNRIAQSTALLTSGLVVLAAVAACAPTVSTSGRMTRLGDKVAVAPQAKATVTMRIQQDAPKNYGLKFISLAEWERAQVSLNRAAPNFTDTVTVNAFTNTNGSRQATINFTNVPTGAGFTLTVNLQRRDANGAYQTIATGTNNSVTIAVGANNANVTVAAVNGQGQLNVSIADPTQTFSGGGAMTGNLASSISTNSFYTLNTATTDPVGVNSISGIAQKGAGYLVGSPVDTRIFDSTNNYQAVVDNGATPYGNRPWGLQRMSDGSYLVAEEHPTNANEGRIRVLRETAANVWEFTTVVAGGGASNADTVASGTSAELSHARYITADEDGTVFFAEVGEGKIWRINPTTSTMMLVSGGWNAFAITGLAWDRTNHRMYVCSTNGAVNNGNVWVLQGDIKGTATPITTFQATLIAALNTFGADPTRDLLLTDSQAPFGLLYDPTGNLYLSYGQVTNVYTTTAPASTGVTGSGIIKIPLNAAGTAMGASGAVRIAGSGQAYTGFPDVVGIGLPGGSPALGYNLPSLYGGGLLMETQNTNGATLGGHLVFGASNDTQTQLLRLTPPTF